jgi:FMN phosphatase YigB (HAD superfamily)
MKELYCGFRPMIAIDCDDTLFVNTMVPDIIRENGLTVTKHSWDMHELGDSVVEELHRRFLMPEYMCNLKPFPGVVEKLNLWHKQGYRMCVATARKQKIHDETLAMVRRYFPYIEDVYCAEDYRDKYRMFSDKMVSGKNALLVEKGCHVLIDDGSHNIAASLHLPWIKRFLVNNKDTFYNEDFVARMKAENLPVTMVSSLAEVEL